MHFKTSLCLLLITLLSAPTEIHAASAEGQRFIHYTFEDGLAQNTVYSIAQDKYGYIWLATEGGLHRFDGNEMQVLVAEPDKDNTLSDSAIAFLEIESNGDVLWIGTIAHGVDRYDIKTGTFTHYQHDPANENSLSSNVNLFLALDSDDNVWVGTENGLNHIDTSTQAITRYTLGKDETEANDNTAFSLAEDQDGNIWVAAYHGLYRKAADATEFVRLDGEGDAYEPFRDHSFHMVRVVDDGRIFTSSRDGIFVLDSAGNILSRYAQESYGGTPESPTIINDLILSEESGLWISTYSRGVFWWNPDKSAFENYRNDPADPWSISDDAIYDLFLDRTGVVWIGTQTGGVNTFNPATRAFKHYRYKKDNENSLPNRVVWTVYEDDKGDVWIGTDAGISRLNRETGNYRHYFMALDDDSGIGLNYGAAIHQDSKGRLWAGTGYGIVRYNAQRDGFERFIISENVDDSYYANTINNLFIDKRDRIWALTYEGMYVFDPASKTFTPIPFDADSPETSPPSATMTSWTESRRHGGYWVAGSNGLALLDPVTKTFSNVIRSSSGLLSHDSVNALLEAEDGSLWVGTSYGLDHIANDTRIKRYTIADGFPSDIIYGIVQDLRGHIWVTTNSGLIELDKEGKLGRVYDVTDGLQSNEFNAGAQFVSPSGEIFLGGINGFNAFYPQDIVRRTTPPSIGITKFFLLNKQVIPAKPLPEISEMDIAWQDNVIGFEFSVFDFAAPKKNLFRYRLDGFESDWVTTTSGQRVTYTNLDPGSYRLEVQGANSQGIWSEDTAQLNLYIAPPPWATWWAYTLYALAFLGALAGGLRLYYIRLADQHSLQSEQQKRRWAETLQQLTQALASSLDAGQVAEELLENLRSMVSFRKAVLYVEQGVEIRVAGAKGFSETQRAPLSQLPGSYSRFFAEVRHSRKPRVFAADEERLAVLREGLGDNSRFLAIPAFSRSDEFALLLIGREAPGFSQQEQDIVSAFLTQALVALDNARLFAELQNLTTTDSLTQVHNRRYFFELAELEFNRSKRYDRDVALILLDADHFKNINDTYGRDIGDRLLKIIASTCRNNLRHFDIIGRYGGEDFIILLPETTLNIAADVADRLRQSIANLSLDTHRGELHVTVSVGVAVADKSVKDLPGLINKADMALYEAKKAGRNRVVVADDTPAG